MRHRIPSSRSVAVAGGTLAAGVGGLYLAGLLVAGGEIDAGTTVRGVDIGGLTRAEATRKLEKHLAAAGSKDLAVKIGDRTTEVDPQRAGLAFDVEQTLDQATGTGADPFTVIGALFRSGSDITPVIQVDEDKTRAVLEKLAKEHNQKMRDGTVVFDGGRAKEVAPQNGYTLDEEAAAATLRSAFLDGTSEAPTALPARETEPEVTAAETQRAMREFARPAMSGPVTLTVGDERLEISQVVVGRHLKTQPDDDGKLVPELDGEGLLADPEMARSLAGITDEPTNAELGLAGDRVVVTADGEPEHHVTAEALDKAVMPLLTESEPAARTGELPTRTTQPKLTRDNVAELGLKEKISSFTVNFEPAEYRTTNVGRAAELINGSLVMPGENWSFNRTVGERTKANGFVDGTIILDGKYSKASGGGVSAVATTVFNAMFFAGVDPVEYGAHSFYIERYPEGREATVAWGSLDLKFNNDSGNAIYIQAEATDTSVTITFLGTKKYDEVTAVKGPRTDVQQPGKRTGDKDQCVPQTPLEGFDVTVERVFREDGDVVKREPFRTHYTPRDRVTCD